MEYIRAYIYLFVAYTRTEVKRHECTWQACRDAVSCHVIYGGRSQVYRPTAPGSTSDPLRRSFYSYFANSTQGTRGIEKDGKGDDGELRERRERPEYPIATGNCSWDARKSPRTRARCRYLAWVETRCESKVERYLLCFLHPSWTNWNCYYYIPGHFWVWTLSDESQDSGCAIGLSVFWILDKGLPTTFFAVH